MLRDLFSLFPAYAGVIPIDDVDEFLGWAFPRICGGDPLFSRIGIDEGTFSPHMRG